MIRKREFGKENSEKRIRKKREFGKKENSDKKFVKRDWIRMKKSAKSRTKYGILAALLFGIAAQGVSIRSDVWAMGLSGNEILKTTNVESVASDTPGRWVYMNNAWYYLDPEGNPATGWIMVKGKYYYLDSDGIMQTGWVTVDGDTYYLDENGRMKVGWLHTEDGWYYLQKNGKMKRGWLNHGSKWYYFGSDGLMRTGWLSSAGNWYFLKDNGAMQTGWFFEEGNWYFFSTDGKMQKGWKIIQGNYYFFKPNGVMHTGWLKDKEKWYYLENNGVMQTGWSEIGGKKYYFSPASGAMQTGFINDGEKKYYLKADGTPIGTGWWVTDGEYYHFDENGAVDQNPDKAPSLVDMPGYYISPMYAGNLNTSEERIEAMIRRAYDYKNAGTTYKICCSQKPGQYADCSGLVMQCLYAAGFDPAPATPAHHALPENEYDSRTLYNKVSMKHVNYSERKRGDLIFYNAPGTKTIIHVAIYLGDNKVIESWPPAVTDKYGITSKPHTSVYAVTRPFE